MFLTTYYTKEGAFFKLLIVCLGGKKKHHDGTEGRMS